MSMFRAGMSVALVLIGAVAAFLGAVVLLSALSSGSLALSYGAGASATSEVVTRASDPARFLQLLTMLGVLPLVFGSLAAIWGWRNLKRS